MSRRPRDLAERPLDPATGRAVLLLAGAGLVGLAALVGLGLVGPGSTSSQRSTMRTRVVAVSPVVPRPTPQNARTPDASSRPARDPLDSPGTSARRRATRELASHRALQHVPWHRDGVSIALAGARRGKAILVVEGPGLAADRRAYRAFLSRFQDDGSAYLPSLRTRGGRR